MEVSTFKCDVCGKIRAADTNHWLIGAPEMRSGQRFGFVIVLWGTPVDMDKSETAHLCGVECAIKWVSAQIGELQ